MTDNEAMFISKLNYYIKQYANFACRGYGGYLDEETLMKFNAFWHRAYYKWIDDMVNKKYLSYKDTVLVSVWCSRHRLGLKDILPALNNTTIITNGCLYYDYSEIQDAAILGTIINGLYDVVSPYAVITIKDHVPTDRELMKNNGVAKYTKNLSIMFTNPIKFTIDDEDDED